MDEGTCKGCGAKINWVKMAKTGKAMPIDPEPNIDGNIILVDFGGTVGIQAAMAEVGFSTPQYISHFATCPKHAEFRKAKR